MPTHSSILLIEDSPGECELFRLALAQTRPDVALYAEHDAEAAQHFLATRAGHEPLPSLILLDWNLRTTRGDRFLQLIRSDARFASIPVVIFTTSDDASDLATGYGYGANGYVIKPGTFQDLVTFIHDLCSYWLHWNRTMYQAGVQC